MEKIWEIDNAPGNDLVKVFRAHIIPEIKNPTDLITVNTPLDFEFEFIVYQDDLFVSIAIEIHTFNGEHIFTSAFSKSKSFKKGVYVTTCYVPAPLLNNGNYTTSLQIVKNNIELVHREKLTY